VIDNWITVASDSHTNYGTHLRDRHPAIVPPDDENAPDDRGPHDHDVHRHQQKLQRFSNFDTINPRIFTVKWHSATIVGSMT
jgi:hypothetical protein